MHTPGPWKPTTTHGQDSKEPFMVWSDQIGAAVAHVYNRSEMASDNHATQRANACLIAASPALLTACRQALAILAQPTTYPADLALIRTTCVAAIALATDDAARDSK